MFKDSLIFLKTILNLRIFKIARIVFLVFFLIALVFYHNEFFVLNRDKVVLVPDSATLANVTPQSIYWWGFLLSIVLILFKRSRDWGLNLISVILLRVICIFQSTKNLIEANVDKEVDEICTLLGVSVRKIWSKKDLTKIIEKWLSDITFDEAGITREQAAEALYDATKASTGLNPDLKTMSFYTDLYKAKIQARFELDALYSEGFNQLTTELQTQSVYLLGTSIIAASAIALSGYLIYLILK